MNQPFTLKDKRNGKTFTLQRKPTSAPVPGSGVLPNAPFNQSLIAKASVSPVAKALANKLT